MTLTVEQIESTYAVPADATRQNYYPPFWPIGFRSNFANKFWPPTAKPILVSVFATVARVPFLSAAK